MSGVNLKLQTIIKNLQDKEEKYTTLDLTHLTAKPNIEQIQEIAEALKTNNVVDKVILEKCEILTNGAIALAEALKVNTTITNFDIGYNKIDGNGMAALAEAFTNNSTLILVKVHRQEKDMGSKAETAFANLWKTNTTLQRCYVTLHDRRCNQENTKGEVRNKSIAACIKQGKNWDHLNPAMQEEQAAKRQKELEEKKKAEDEANKPIDSKIESTGGPYTLKQLSCQKQYLPDDVDTNKKETYLSDEEFEEVFKISKAEFSKLAKWKQTAKKKALKLH